MKLQEITPRSIKIQETESSPLLAVGFLARCTITDRSEPIIELRMWFAQDNDVTAAGAIVGPIIHLVSIEFVDRTTKLHRSLFRWDDEEECLTIFCRRANLKVEDIS